MITAYKCCLTNHFEISTFLLNKDICGLISFLDQQVVDLGESAILSANKQLASPVQLALLLNIILKDGLYLQKVQMESYYHENGFHKLVVLSGQFFKLRLHHFGVGVRIPMENIHDHRWVFASSIIKGHLHMELFKPTKIGSLNMIHYKYDSRKSSGEYGLDLIGLEQVDKTEIRHYAPGQQYLMLPNELHRITNKPGEEIITLILTGKPERHNCNLYAKRPLQKFETKMEKYSERELRKMFLALIEKINPTINLA